MPIINTSDENWTQFWDSEQHLFEVMLSEAETRLDFFVGVRHRLQRCRSILRNMVEIREENQLSFVTYAIRISLCLSHFPERLQQHYYLLNRPILISIKRWVSGQLYTLIQLFQHKWDLFEPHQAPKGWTCSLCLQNHESHLCVKTNCNHYYHYNCYNKLTSAICPLCRSHIQ
jgi:hypothetical protein